MNPSHHIPASPSDGCLPKDLLRHTSFYRRVCDLWGKHLPTVDSHSPCPLPPLLFPHLQAAPLDCCLSFRGHCTASDGGAHLQSPRRRVPQPAVQAAAPPLSLLALCKAHRASGLRTASLPPFGLTIPPQGCAQVEQLLSCCKLLSFTFAPLAGQCRPHVSIAAAPGWLRKSYHSWDLWKE